MRSFPCVIATYFHHSASSACSQALWHCLSSFFCQAETALFYSPSLPTTGFSNLSEGLQRDFQDFRGQGALKDQRINDRVQHWGFVKDLARREKVLLLRGKKNVEDGKLLRLILWRAGLGTRPVHITAVPDQPDAPGGRPHVSLGFLRETRLFCSPHHPRFVWNAQLRPEFFRFCRALVGL